VSDAPPLLEAVSARVTIDGAVALDRVSFSSVGDRVLVAGDTSALFAVLTNVALGLRAASAAAAGASGDDAAPIAEASLAAGSLRVDGVGVGERGYFATIGAAALDPPLPPRWSAVEYVTWSARLGGASRGAAGELAAAALEKVGLKPVKARLLSAMSLPERRAVGLAQAIALGPRVLVAEAPLAGLDGAAADFVLRAVGGATDGRRAILSGTRVDPASPEGLLVRGASHVVVLAGGDVAFEGPPSELGASARLYTLLVRARVVELRAELAARGIDLRGGPQRFSIALPAGASTRDVLVAARAVDAPLLELVPLLGG
jgi:ABC-2 type transport system ATP-binding protein